MASKSEPYGQSSVGHVRGWAYGADTAERIAAVLRWDGARVTLSRDNGAELTTDPVTRVERLGATGLLVLWGDDWRFECDGDAAAALDGLPSPRPADWIEGLERSGPRRLLVFVAVTLFGLFAIWRWGLDIMVAAAVAVTPPAMLNGIDASQMAIFDRTMASESQLSADEKAKVTAIFDRLVDVAPAPKSGAYRLEFRDLGEALGPNAFALPGGTMVITDAIVRDFPDEDILAGVIGHEMAHVTELHGLRQLYRALSSYVLITVILGDPGSVLQDILLEGNAVLALRYSRAAEAEADRLGVGYAQAAGFEGAALAQFFVALDAKMGGSAGPGWLSTHPDSGDRAESIRKLAEEAQ